jgi:hypothetical protein
MINLVTKILIYFTVYPLEKKKGDMRLFWINHTELLNRRECGLGFETALTCWDRVTLVNIL